MRWLALHLPLLPLEAFCATLATDQRERPVVLLKDHRVHTVNAVAAQCGIRPGNQRATAMALAADLLVAQSCPLRNAAAVRAVVHAALAFTPSVSLHQSAQDVHTVLLEVQASLRLFGGWATLLQRLSAAVAPLGHRVQMAAAPTALGAALLAQWWPKSLPRSLPKSMPKSMPKSLPQSLPQTKSPGSPKGLPQSLPQSGPPGLPPPSPPPKAQDGAPQQPPAEPPASPPEPDDLVHGAHSTELPALRALLDRAPVWLLGPGREHWEALQGMGLQTLADLRALPRTGLARRFGVELLDELDRALGLRPDPRQWLALPARFETRLELFARAENTEQVLHAAAVLLARLVAWAQAHQGRVRAFTLQMLHERARQAAVPPTELRIELAEPALDPAHLQLLLRERLARCILAAPTLELRLQCQELVAAPAPNAELFPTRAGHDEGLLRLLERLCARLGDAQVHCLVPVADHRPEHASRAVPAQAGRLPLAFAASSPVLQVSTLPLHRPAWLLPEPVPLAEREAMPWWQGRPLQVLSGPERIETGWWDEHPVTRDYFIAMTEDGSLVWIYRARLPTAPGEVSWYLQGRFG